MAQYCCHAFQEENDRQVAFERVLNDVPRCVKVVEDEVSVSQHFLSHGDHFLVVIKLAEDLKRGRVIVFGDQVLQAVLVRVSLIKFNAWTAPISRFRAC